MPVPDPAFGTYVLILRCRQEREIRVGQLGRLRLPRGYYLYVGSAFGPGGVRARCGHHIRIAARPRWHIDYLRAVCDLEQIWFTHDPLRREHEWAQIISGMRGSDIPFPGFGASDCTCPTHLFYRPRCPRMGTFQKHVFNAQPEADVHRNSSDILLTKVTSSASIWGISRNT